MLKEARKQSGASWDDKLCMIVADEPVWENIITSYPKASKFKSKSFPLFETLGELYDGHTAEGSLNLTSLPDPTPSEPSITQISVGDGLEAEEFESPQMPLNVEDEYDDDDLRILEHPNAARAREATAEVQRKQKESTVPDGRKKSLKKQKKEDLSYKMERYLEVKTKQVESEVAEKSRVGSGVDEYSIKNCITLMNTMAELTREEKAIAVDVFKDAQNREIFMSADSTTRLIWIKRKCMQA